MKREDFLKVFPPHELTGKPAVWFRQGEVLDICERVQHAVREELGVNDDVEPPKKPGKTEMIFNARSPYNNHFQGEDKRVLFVCSAGILRSATAARIYAHKYNTRCAGTRHYALIPLTEELLLWAQEIVFVNPDNHWDAKQKFDFREFDCKITVLSIEDDYDHMDPKLIEEFNEQYEPSGY